MLTSIRRLLSSPRAPWIAALLAALLLAPTIGSGLFMDDLALRVIRTPEFQAPGGPMGDWDIFRFQGPDRSYLELNRDRGLWPWWVAPDYRLAFFRPLSSLSHMLDYKMWPDAAWLMHVENIAIYTAMALLVGLFYRRHVKPAWAAGLAAIFFAIDDAHSMSVVWVASRNTILAALFGLAAILAHDEARRGSRKASVVAPLLFALGLLAGEGAVASAGYLAAYAAFVDEAPVASRVRSLVPYALVGLAWLITYKALGYGAHGGSFYVDPGSEPLLFLKALVTRFPELLAAQLAGPPAEFWAQVPNEKLATALAAVAALLLALGVLIYRAVKTDRAARFFAAGMLLSCVPVSATWPSDRLLLFVGFGAFGLIAIFLGRAGEAAGRAERAIAKSVAVFFIFLHGFVAAVLLPVRCLSSASFLRGYTDRAERTLPADPELSRSMLVVLNAPDSIVVSDVFADRRYHGGALPKSFRQLAMVEKGTAEITRVDESTLSMTQNQGFFQDMWSLLFRATSVPFHVGDTVTTKGMRVEIAEVLPDGRPRRVLFHFDEPLDSDALRWVRWEGMGFVPAAPPRPGQTLALEPTDFMKIITGSK